MALLGNLTSLFQSVSNAGAGVVHSGELIDVGEITRETGLPLNGSDNAEADPTGIDADIFSFRSADGNQSGLLELGLLPQSSDSWTLTDIDLLSGSYGADGFVTMDLGPDITDEPVINANILMTPENPFVLEILGQPVLDPLNDIGSNDGLLPLAIVGDLLGGGVTNGLPLDLGGVTDIVPLDGIGGLTDILPVDLAGDLLGGLLG